MYRLVSLSVMLTLIVVLGITFFKVVAPYILPLFVAGVFAILAQPLFRYFTMRTGGRVRLASALTTGTIVSAILIPMVLVTSLASTQLYVFAGSLTSPDGWDRVFGSVREGTTHHTDSLAKWAADLLNTLRRPPELRLRLESDTPPAQEEKTEPAPDTTTDTDAVAPVVPSPETNAVATPAEGRTKSAEAAAVPAGADATAPGTATADDQLADVSAATPAAAAPVDEQALEAEFEKDDLKPLLQSEHDVTPEQIKTYVRMKVRDLLIDLGDRSMGIVTGVFFSIVSGIVGLLIFTVALYYFFADGAALIAATESLIPVHVDYQRELLDQFARVVRSVVSATFLAGLGQAVATVVALGLCGFNHLTTLFVLCFLTAMIPMLGTWLVWGPCAILLATSGHWGVATLLTLYGVLVVGLLDNVIRTYVLNTDIKLHPLLALISVLGGLQVMGLWGMFIGPIIASCLHALVKIFNHELVALSRSRFAEQALEVATAGAAAAQHAASAAESSLESAVASAAAIPTASTPHASSSSLPAVQTPSPGRGGQNSNQKKSRRRK